MPFGHDRIAELVAPIDYTKSRPVDMMAIFNTVAEIKPVSFRVQLEDESYQTYKIESVKYTKELKGRTLFCCVYVVDGVERDVVLGYYYEDHRWGIES
jgi:hypothetical protein